jgi:CBS-domain-containing membrane protein
VANAEGRLLGVVGLEEVSLASDEPALKSLILAEDLLRTDVHPLTLDSSLDHALELFFESDLLSLPVVNNLDQRRIIGMVRHHEIASNYLRRVHAPAPAD